MTNYLCSANGDIHHFFYDNSRGICRRLYHAGVWGDMEIICRDGADGFCAYIDAGGNIHLLCTNKEHEILYFLYKGEAWHRCVITKNRADVTPIALKIGIAQGRIQLFFTAQYQDNIVLIHSVLGVNAKPEVIDTLKYDDYAIYGTRIYYTNADDILGYQDFSDGKPDRFIPMFEHGRQPCVCGHGMVYMNNQSIMFGDKEVYSDPYASCPILLCSGDKLMLMWQSSGFVRYMTSSDDGKTWNGPMRFVSANREVRLYHAHINGTQSYFYGNHTDRDINIFGISDWMHPSAQSLEKQSARGADDDIELKKLKIMLEMMKSEMVKLKQQMNELRDILKEDNK